MQKEEEKTQEKIWGTDEEREGQMVKKRRSCLYGAETRGTNPIKATCKASHPAIIHSLGAADLLLSLPGWSTGRAHCSPYLDVAHKVHYYTHHSNCAAISAVVDCGVQ